MKRFRVLVLVCLIAALNFSRIFKSLAQEIVTSKPKATLITSKNAGQVKEVGRLGKGRFQGNAWSPDGKLYVVASRLGIWIYNFTSQPTVEEKGLAERKNT